MLSTLGVLLFLASIGGSIVLFILLIINAVKKNPIKYYALGMLLCGFLFVVSIVMVVSDPSIKDKSFENNVDESDDVEKKDVSDVKQSENEKNLPKMNETKQIHKEDDTTVDDLKKTENLDKKNESTIPEQAENDSANDVKVDGDNLVIDIVAGELGEYGQELVLNEGTEFEDRTIGYFVPSGVYEVTNVGDYKSQVNIYKMEKKKVDGWEEWGDGHVELIDVNETKVMTVEEGYLINVDAPTHIKVKKIDSVNDSESLTGEQFDDDYIKNHDIEIVAAAKLALDNFISGYKMSLAPQKWIIAKFDDTNTVIGMTEIDYNGRKGKYIYVGTLDIDISGKVTSAKPHYIEVNGEVLGNDGYCDDVFEKIKALSQ